MWWSIQESAASQHYTLVYVIYGKYVVYLVYIYLLQFILSEVKTLHSKLHKQTDKLPNKIFGVDICITNWQ